MIDVPFGRKLECSNLYKIRRKTCNYLWFGGERIGGFLIAQDIDTEEVIWSIESTQKGLFRHPYFFMKMIRHL